MVKKQKNLILSTSKLQVGLQRKGTNFSPDMVDKYNRRTITSGENSLTTEQCDKLLSVIVNLKHEVLFRLELASGMRRADIVAVQRANINFETNEILFEERKKNKIHSIFVSDELIRKIKQLIENSRDSKWLFPSPKLGKFKTKHMHDRQAHKIFQEYLVKSGIKEQGDNLPFHVLRATAIKRCAERGWSEIETAKLVDDKVSTIQMHYSTPSREQMRKVAREKPL